MYIYTPIYLRIYHKHQRNPCSYTAIPSQGSTESSTELADFEATLAAMDAVGTSIGFYQRWVCGGWPALNQEEIQKFLPFFWGVGQEFVRVL